MNNKFIFTILFVLQIVFANENTVRMYATGSVIGYIDKCG
tara:strand:- start:1357 stop:1476 length:120 start_codon:yes stop_codon:yes gene_type:complete